MFVLPYVDSVGFLRIGRYSRLLLMDKLRWKSKFAKVNEKWLLIIKHWDSFRW
jgi:hypothetical protein